MTHLEQFVFIVLVPGNLTGTVQDAFSAAGYYLCWQRRWGKPGNPYNPNQVGCDLGKIECTYMICVMLL